jgi:hypothetical protein
MGNTVKVVASAFPAGKAVIATLPNSSVMIPLAVRAENAGMANVFVISDIQDLVVRQVGNLDSNKIEIISYLIGKALKCYRTFSSELKQFP